MYKIEATVNNVKLHVWKLLRDLKSPYHKETNVILYGDRHRLHLF